MNLNVLDSLAENICILDGNMQIIAVNKTWCDFADENQLESKDYCIGLNYIDICDSAAIKGVEGAIEFAEGIRAVNNGDITAFAHEYPCHSPETARWFIGRVTQLLNPAPARLIIAHENITERKLAEELTKEYALRLKNSNASKDKLFSYISHDLKNTFHGLLGLSDVLAISINNLEKQEIEEIGKEINNALKEQYKQLENMLIWSRMQLGQIIFKPEVINLKQIVDENLEFLKTYYNQKKIRVVNHLVNIYLTIDRTLLNSILQNLIMNAIKFTSSLGAVTIYSNTGAEYLDIMVEDTGVGITEEDIKKLFNSSTHFSFTGTRGETGSGLGLLMCKEMAETIGGKINVKSRIGKGSTFILSIPIANVNL